MTTLQNTDGAIAQSVALTRQARSDLSAQIRALDGQLAHLGQNWVGEGAVTFVRVKDAWNHQVQRLLGALDEFGAHLEGVDRTFGATDADVTTGLQQLGHRLG